MSDQGRSYAEDQRDKLDAKVRELRAEGWDVVARRDRDKALNERDDATDERDELRAWIQRVAPMLEAAKMEMGAVRECLRIGQTASAVDRLADMVGDVLAALSATDAERACDCGAVEGKFFTSHPSGHAVTCATRAATDTEKAGDGTE